MGDLLAASRDLRSFDKEDAESDAGKARAQKFVKDYFADYAQNAAVAPDETDMFGTPPPTREEMMRHFRENGRDAGPRFSVNPNLRADIDAALNTDPAKGAVVKGGKRVVFGRSQRLFPALGLPDGDIYSKAYALRKIANDHNLTAEQLAAAPSLMEEPAAVFDDNGNGYVFLTDAIASDEDGKDAPVMFYIRPDGEGNYIASAYARKERAESKYVNLVNAGMVRYWDKSKIARLPLRGEAQSSLITFSAGDSVVTPEGLTPQSVSQSGAPAQGGNYSVAAPLVEAMRNRQRYSVAGIFTGSAADYANRSRQGGVDDGPSVKYIGTGEGSQVYGWGLYGSTERGVAEGYAKDAREYNAEKNGKRIDLIFPKNMLEAETAKRLMENDGDVRKTIEKLKRKGIGSAIIKELEEHGSEYSVGPKHEQLYEQTFFTNRAEGDESHLLKWYEPVTDEQKQWIERGLQTTDLGLPGGARNSARAAAKLMSEVLSPKSSISGGELYQAFSDALGSPQAASEFLYRAGIDGVKYPVDSYGKTVKDGDKAGWNYVAFSDEHIRVDHKWTDGQMRYSISVTPEMRRETTVNAAEATLEKTKAALAALAGKPLINDETKIEAWINDVQARKIVSNKAVAKSEANGFTKAEHNAAAAIIETLWKYATLGKSAPDRDGDPNIRSVKRFVSPVFFRNGEGKKDAYAYITAKESVEHGHRIYSIEIEKL